jgi:hypothetical protein
LEEVYSSRTHSKKGNVMKRVKNFLKVGLVLVILLASAANASGTLSSGSSVKTPKAPTGTLSKPGWGG